MRWYFTDPKNAKILGGNKKEAPFHKLDVFPRSPQKSWRDQRKIFSAEKDFLKITLGGVVLKGSRPLATQIWPKMSQPIVIYNGKSMEMYQNFERHQK